MIGVSTSPGPRRHSYGRRMSSRQSSSTVDGDSRRRSYSSSSCHESDQIRGQFRGGRNGRQQELEVAPRRPWKETDDKFDGSSRRRVDRRRVFRSNRDKSQIRQRTNGGLITNNSTGMVIDERSSNAKRHKIEDFIYPIRFLYLPPFMSHPNYLCNYFRQFSWYNITQYDIRCGEATVELADPTTRAQVARSITSRLPYVAVNMLPPVPVSKLYGPNGERREPIPIIPANGVLMGPPSTARKITLVDCPKSGISNNDGLSNIYQSDSLPNITTSNAEVKEHKDFPGSITTNKYISEHHRIKIQEMAEARERTRQLKEKKRALLQKYTVAMQEAIAKTLDVSLSPEQKHEIQIIISKIQTRIAELTRKSSRKNTNSSWSNYQSDTRQHKTNKTSELNSSWNKNAAFTIHDFPTHVVDQESLIEWTVSKSSIFHTDEVEYVSFEPQEPAVICYADPEIAVQAFNNCRANGITVNWIETPSEVESHIRRDTEYNRQNKSAIL